MSASTRLPLSVDLHTHTNHSHGQADVLSMYNAGIAHGLTVIGFSEHSPRPQGYTYPEDYQEKLVAGFSGYIAEVSALKAPAAERNVTVLLGLEVDYIPGHEDYAAGLVKSHAYDYIIGGLHFQGTWGFDFAAADWDALDRQGCFAAYARYYADLERMCRTGLFHIAAHPDLIKIFSAGRFREWLGTDAALPLVRAALHAMKEHGVLMEISSAGLRKPCREIYPGPEIMQAAADIGLRVSFGSDAHCTNTPAYAFAELARYAAGFGYAESSIVVQGRASARPFHAPEPLSPLTDTDKAL